VSPGISRREANAFALIRCSLYVRLLFTIRWSVQHTTTSHQPALSLSPPISLKARDALLPSQFSAGKLRADNKFHFASHFRASRRSHRRRVVHGRRAIDARPTSPSSLRLSRLLPAAVSKLVISAEGLYSADRAPQPSSIIKISPLMVSQFRLVYCHRRQDVAALRQRSARLIVKPLGLARSPLPPAIIPER